MKRVTAIALAFLVALNLCVSAFALTLAPVADKDSVAAGEDVTVTMSLDEAITEVTSLQARLYFDQEKFTFKSGSSDVSNVTVNQNVQTDKDTGKPYIAVNYIDMATGKGNILAGTYAAVTFTAKADIADVSSAEFSALIAKSLMVDGSDSSNTEKSSISVTVTPASTEPGYTVAASATNSITVGDTAQVTLTVGNTGSTVTAYNAYDMTVTYNADVLKYDSVADVNGETPNVVDNNGTLRITGYGSNKTCGTHNIVLSFTSKITGSADVTVTSAKVDAKDHAIANDAPEANITAKTVTIKVGGYKVTLHDDFTGAGTAEPGKDYTFIAKDTSKKYDFTGSTMGGSDVKIIDNGNGSYTVENVTGPLKITATALVKINLDNQAGAAIDGITDGAYVNPNTAINFTVTPDADKELVVTVNGEEITGMNRQGMYTYAIAADKVTGTELNIVVSYKSSTDTITIIGSGDAWNDVDHDSSIGWDESGKVTDKTSATLNIKPATGKTIDDYVVTINGVTQSLTQTGRGPRIRYMVTFVPADEAVDGKIAIDVSYKKAAEPTITVDVSEYVKLNGQSIFLITATGENMADGQVLAYGDNQMYWSAKYNESKGAYAWLVISNKTLEEIKTAAAAQVKAVTGTKVEIAYTGDVNLTGNVDINDAQLVWNMYNAEYSDFTTVNVRKFLEADMTADGTLDTSDAVAVTDIVIK